MYSLARSVPAMALVVLLLAACGAGPTATESPGPTPSAGPQMEDPGQSPTPFPEVGVKVGQLAPAFGLTTIDGEVVHSSQLAEGGPLLLFFFATW